MKKRKLIFYSLLFITFSFFGIRFITKNIYTPLNFKDDYNISMNVELHPLESEIDSSSISSSNYDWVYVLGSSDYDEYAHVVIEDFLDSFQILRGKPHTITFLYYNSGMPLSNRNNDQHWLGHNTFWNKYMLTIQYFPTPYESMIIKKYRNGTVTQTIDIPYNDVIIEGLGNSIRKLEQL